MKKAPRFGDLRAYMFSTFVSLMVGHASQFGALRMRDFVKVTSEASPAQAESVSPGTFSPIESSASQPSKSTITGSVQAFVKPERVSSVHRSENKGCESSITHPQTLHFIGGGLDWLKLWCFGRAVPAKLYDQLLKARDRAQLSERPIIFKLGNIFWTVQPKGVSKAANYMPVTLTSSGLTIAFCQRESGPVAMIQAEGAYCGAHTPQGLFKHLKEVVSSCGVAASRYTISRMDIHGDLAGVHVSRVVKAFAEENIVKRSKKWKLEGEGTFAGVQGCYFGARARAVARIYDKAKHVAQDPDMQRTYLNRFGLTEMPENVLRAEFELHAEFFSELWGTVDAERVFQMLETLVGYLMHDWLRVCSSVDHNHTDRAKPQAFWAHLRNKMMGCMSGTEPRPKVVRPVPQVSRLFRQMAGIANTICAALGQGPGTVKDALNLLSEEYNESDNLRFRDDIERKITLFDQREAEFWRLVEARDAEREKEKSILGGLSDGSCAR